ncbi:MAG: hypothetical protein GX071_05435 [Gammaproteobacteria bacterium]|nr:hypothetical protein [Gammaproteobacteria bacterium]
MHNEALPAVAENKLSESDFLNCIRELVSYQDQPGTTGCVYAMPSQPGADGMPVIELDELLGMLDMTDQQLLAKLAQYRFIVWDGGTIHGNGWVNTYHPRLRTVTRIYEG